MSIKKALVNIYCGLIRNKEKRRAVRDVLLLGSDDRLVFVGGFLTAGDITWSEYMLMHNMPEMVAALRHGLDNESNELLDLIFSRMTIFPRGSGNNYRVRDSFLDTLITQQEKESLENFRMELPAYRKEFKLDENCYNFDTFYFHNSLRWSSEKLKKYIAGKDFIDGGAYIGDSALVYIKRYDPRCVYSFEISEKTCARYENVMRMNNIPADKYKLVPMGLSDKKQEIMMNDTAFQGTTVLNKGTSKVQLTDIDSFTQENNLNVGFIKADVEGVGLEATLGMTETIKRDRPVVYVAMYHNPQEFFEIKPTLEKTTSELGYKFSIVKEYLLADRMLEVAVFAYPKELDHE